MFLATMTVVLIPSDFENSMIPLVDTSASGDHKIIHHSYENNLCGVLK